PETGCGFARQWRARSLIDCSRRSARHARQWLVALANQAVAKIQYTAESCVRLCARGLKGSDAWSRVCARCPGRRGWPAGPRCGFEPVRGLLRVALEG